MSVSEREIIPPRMDLNFALRAPFCGNYMPLFKFINAKGGKAILLAFLPVLFSSILIFVYYFRAEGNLGSKRSIFAVRSARRVENVLIGCRGNFIILKCDKL